MFFLLMNKREILDFTAEQLQYIPKILLLQEFENYVEILWDRLPNHLKTDPEVQRCRLLNKTINALPFEVHIPGYQFCGPGTRLVKRLARGDRGINRLDAACREHDIAYSRSNHLTDRHIADRRGGVLPILSMLGALGSLIVGAASVARVVSDRKAARRQSEGRGLYLAPYKRGGSVRKRKKTRGKKKHCGRKR
ncbi:hypothetical protein ALC57_16044 [Trachymyrmex cornetzi]|uniref:Phospholipase A2-like domain-containing protein n=1 Tax=Trachymyrmex cornetzi TaxID=471704 RepID=A0A151IVS3_9HYME|nr:hypothetical protein ALC57_16044 [Trachymyrmex cornetzi]